MNPLLLALLLAAFPGLAQSQNQLITDQQYQEAAAVLQVPAIRDPDQNINSASTTFASVVAADVFADTNEERQQNGLSPLTQNATLTRVANQHSSDMLANNYFNHIDLSGCGPSCRLTNAGYAWQAMGENIYMMTGYNLDAAGTAQQIVNAWMNSPEHRANLLNSSYTQAGVGIASQGSTVYATSDYAKPQSE